MCFWDSVYGYNIKLYSMSRLDPKMAVGSGVSVQMSKLQSTYPGVLCPGTGLNLAICYQPGYVPRTILDFRSRSIHRLPCQNVQFTKF